MSDEVSRSNEEVDYRLARLWLSLFQLNFCMQNPEKTITVILTLTVTVAVVTQSAGCVNSSVSPFGSTYMEDQPLFHNVVSGK